MNRTKRAIIDTFWQLLEEPNSKITVQNIVERCQVNRNTFYYHFQDIPTLVEFSIQAWAESVIDENFQLDSLANCIIPITQELMIRKAAFIRLYRSVNRELLLRYLNEINRHIAQIYIEYASKDVAVPIEDRQVLIRYYKCLLTGVIIDWLDNDASYDLSVFFEKMLALFEGSGKISFFGLFSHNSSATGSQSLA